MVPEGEAMNFDRDIRQLVLTRLSAAGLKTNGLEQESTETLLTAYFNASSRLVPARPRTVHRSAAFTASLGRLAQKVQRAVVLLRESSTTSSQVPR